MSDLVFKRGLQRVDSLVDLGRQANHRFMDSDSSLFYPPFYLTRPVFGLGRGPSISPTIGPSMRSGG